MVITPVINSQKLQVAAVPVKILVHILLTHAVNSDLYFLFFVAGYFLVRDLCTGTGTGNSFRETKICAWYRYRYLLFCFLLLGFSSFFFIIT
jgi:hypothetical protein